MFWLEVIGVIAFGICGAMAAMERGADLFGVLFLAVITALGGGVIKGRAARLVPAADVHKLCLCGDRRGQRIAGVS